MMEETEKLSDKDKHFKGQLLNEDLECFYRYHWVVLVLPIFLYTAFIFAFVLFLIFMRQTDLLTHDSVIFKILLVLSFLISTYCVHRFFVHIYNYFLHIVIVTNYRIVDLKKTLILHDTKEVIDIAKIQDVVKLQDGLVRNVLKFGKLVITLSSASSVKTLHFIPNPDFHFRVINRKKREYIQQKQFDRRKSAGLEPEFPEKEVDPYSSGVSENVFME